MICRNCKRRIPDDSIICPKCKKPTINIANNTQTEKHSTDRKNLAVIMTAAIIMIFFSLSAMPFIIGKGNGLKEDNPEPSIDNSVVIPSNSIPPESTDETSAPDQNDGNAENAENTENTENTETNEYEQPAESALSEETAENNQTDTFPAVPTIPAMPDMPTIPPADENAQAESMPTIPDMPTMPPVMPTRKAAAKKSRPSPTPEATPEAQESFRKDGPIVNFDVPTLERNTLEENE